MWGAVKKVDPGLRAYQKQRASGAPLSRCALMAQVNAKVSVDYLRLLESTSSSLEVETLDSSEKPSGRNLPKYLVVGGAIALACTLDRGLLTKAVIFGVARRFAKMGKRLWYRGGGVCKDSVKGILLVRPQLRGLDFLPLSLWGLRGEACNFTSTGREKRIESTDIDSLKC